MTAEARIINDKIDEQEEEEEEELDVTNESKAKLWTKRIWIFFVKNYLPIALIFAVTFGALVPQPGVFFNHKVTVYICVAILFLYVGLYLRTSAIKDAVKSYKAYLWAILSILVVTCIIGGQLTSLLEFDDLGARNMVKQSDAAGNSTMKTNVTNTSNKDTQNAQKTTLGPFEAKVGLIMYNIMPCTVGTGVIMVMGMKGHVALGILITVFCNVVGIFTIPLYLKWLVYSNVNANFNIPDMMLKLFCSLFIPLFIGKLLRFNKKVRDIISMPSRKMKLKMFALTALAFILLIKTSQSSYNGDLKLVTGTTALVICFWALMLHCIYLVINTVASFVLRLPTDQKKCVIILASQKTLSQAVAATVFLPDGVGDQGLIAVSMVFCHITVLVFDSILIPAWLYVEERRQKKNGAESDLEMEGVLAGKAEEMTES